MKKWAMAVAALAAIGFYWWTGSDVEQGAPRKSIFPYSRILLKAEEKPAVSAVVVLPEQENSSPEVPKVLEGARMEFLSSPQDSLTRREFIDALNQKDVCEFFSEKIATQVSSTLLVRELYHRSTGKNGSSSRLVNINSVTLFFEAFSLPNAESAIARFSALAGDFDLVSQFFQALLLADLMDGFPNPKPNYPAAIKILSSLKAKLPENSAFPYFMGMAHLEAGRPEEAAVEFRAAMKKEKFDTFLTTILRVVWENGLQDPKIFAMAKTLMQRAPRPVLVPGFEWIGERISPEDTEWSSLALAFGRLSMREGIREKARPPEIYWWPAEYELGRQLARKAWNILNPGANASAFDSEYPAAATLPSIVRMIPWGQLSFPQKAKEGKKCDEDAFLLSLKALVQENWTYHEDERRR